MDKDAQGYIDLSDLDLTSCHFKGDVISKVSFFIIKSTTCNIRM
ncbi:hypothetical protein ECSTECDG1313_5266 [Escherichia coli STEC_DG131-3]|nr:hypothetical protein ECSTECDG1313_5266 [Escherichia coli STEC_DG131-3]